MWLCLIAFQIWKMRGMLRCSGPYRGGKARHGQYLKYCSLLALYVCDARKKSSETNCKRLAGPDHRKAPLYSFLKIVRLLEHSSSGG